MHERLWRQRRRLIVTFVICALAGLLAHSTGGFGAILQGFQAGVLGMAATALVLVALPEMRWLAFKLAVIGLICAVLSLAVCPALAGDAEYDEELQRWLDLPEASQRWGFRRVDGSTAGRRWRGVFAPFRNFAPDLQPARRCPHLIFGLHVQRAQHGRAPGPSAPHHRLRHAPRRPACEEKLMIVPAPFINHTDAELALIEELVGRTTPFAFSSGSYEVPRRRNY